MSKAGRSSPAAEDFADDDAPVNRPARPPEPPPSSEPAVAAIVLGAVFSLGAAPTIHLIHVLWTSGFAGLNDIDRVVAAVVGFLVGLFALAMLVMGFVFGVRSVLAARRHGRPLALPLTGTMLAFFAFWVWIGVAACWTGAVIDRM